MGTEVLPPGGDVVVRRSACRPREVASPPARTPDAGCEGGSSEPGVLRPGRHDAIRCGPRQTCAPSAWGPGASGSFADLSATLATGCDRPALPKDKHHQQEKIHGEVGPGLQEPSPLDQEPGRVGEIQDGHRHSCSDALRGVAYREPAVLSRWINRACGTPHTPCSTGHAGPDPTHRRTPGRSHRYRP